MLRTAQQRKDICADCPVARVADLVGDSCSLLIIRDLMEGAKRYSDLEQSLAGISSRTLSKKLDILEREKMLKRREVRGKPNRVEYSLTPKGRAFQGVVDAMRSYGKKYL